MALQACSYRPAGRRQCRAWWPSRSGPTSRARFPPANAHARLAAACRQRLGRNTFASTRETRPSDAPTGNARGLRGISGIRNYDSLRHRFDGEGPRISLCLAHGWVRTGGEGGIRTLTGPLDSVTCRFHSADVVVNASDAIAPCPLLPAAVFAERPNKYLNCLLCDEPNAAVC